MTYAPNCAFCGEPVDITASNGWLRGVKGWEEPRKGGGANRIVLREVEPRYAHRRCVFLVQHGVSQDQTKLL